MHLLCLLKGRSYYEDLCRTLGKKGVQRISEGSLTVLQIATLPSETANLKVNPQRMLLASRGLGEVRIRVIWTR